MESETDKLSTSNKIPSRPHVRFGCGQRPRCATLLLPFWRGLLWLYETYRQHYRSERDNGNLLGAANRAALKEWAPRLRRTREALAAPGDHPPPGYGAFPRNDFGFGITTRTVAPGANPSRINLSFPGPRRRHLRSIHTERCRHWRSQPSAQLCGLHDSGLSVHFPCFPLNPPREF